MRSKPVYLMCAQVAPSGECIRDKYPPDRIAGKTWRRLFLAAYSRLNLVVAAVLRDSMSAVSFQRLATFRRLLLFRNRKTEL